MPARVPGMTPADPADTSPGTGDRSVLLNRTDEVMTARWLKSTLLSENRAQENLVKPNARNQTVARKLEKSRPEVHRHTSLSPNHRSEPPVI
jgi:hypothetical protein